MGKGEWMGKEGKSALVVGGIDALVPISTPSLLPDMCSSVFVCRQNRVQTEFCVVSRVRFRVVYLCHA